MSWVDDSSLLQLMYSEKMDRPDIIGAISRSPVKRYNGGEWNSVYTPKWFYNGPVLRLNENEERELILKDEYKGTDWVKKITFIRHAVDLEYWKNTENRQKKYVLWAGNVSRDAKNYPLFEEIMKKTKLPNNYEFKVLSGYSIEQYNDILKNTAILVNTSKYESFCCAVNEGRSMGVVTLVRKNFNGDYMFKDQFEQVDYNADAYSKKILEILEKGYGYVLEKGKEEREWAEKNISLDVMRDDITKVIKDVYKKKNE